MLKAIELVKKFGRRTVVDRVSLEVGRGEIVGLLGKNGAGKTTTFHMAMGMLKPDAGQVTFDGREITKLPMYRRARLGLGYLPQDSSVFRGLSTRNNLLAILETVPISRKERKVRLEKILTDFGLKKVADNRAASLSGGERRRLEIARALITAPTILLLDEPFTGVDPIAVADVKEIVVGLVSRQIGILVTDHNVRDTLSITDMAYILEDGKILASGSPEELVKNEIVRSSYLGEGFIRSFEEEAAEWEKKKQATRKEVTQTHNA